MIESCVDITPTYFSGKDHIYGLEGRKKASENHEAENNVDHLIKYYQENLC